MYLLTDRVIHNFKLSFNAARLPVVGARGYGCAGEIQKYTNADAQRKAEYTA